MARVKIFTDSAADLPKHLVERRNIGVVPILVSFPERTYADGDDLTAEEFYPMLKGAPRLPVTSQPSPQDFIDAFRPHLEAGDSVVSINLSSGLSGTVESALLAGDTLGKQAEGKLFVVDSQAASLGQGLLVALAADLAEQGANPEQIVAAVLQAREKLCHLFTLDTMENLVKGGRISKAKGTLGDLLNIKPILHISDDGKIDLKDRVRGRKKSLKYLIEEYQAGLAKDYRYIAVSHANCPDEAQDVIKQMEQAYPEAEMVVGTIGAAVGTHTGQGCIAIFYFK